MNILKAIGRGFLGLLLLVIAAVGFVLGVLVCCTLIGLPIGFLMMLGSLGITAFVIRLWGKPEVEAQVRGWMSSLTGGRLASRQKV